MDQGFRDLGWWAMFVLSLLVVAAATMGQAACTIEAIKCDGHAAVCADAPKTPTDKPR
jgi:hypothetical protein